MLGLTGDLLDQLASALDGCVDLGDGLELQDGALDLFVTEIIGWWFGHVYAVGGADGIGVEFGEIKDIEFSAL